MSRKTFAVSTLGCRINFYESAAIAEEFLRHGYEQVTLQDEWDVFLIHSCAVTAEAEKKGRALISRALKQKKEHGGIVCVFGCLAQKRKDELLHRYPELDLVLGNADMGKVYAFCEECLGGARFDAQLVSLGREYNTPPITSWYSPRAFVKIQDGCNSFCTYCIVPYLRGRERNRASESILSEVRTLAAGGVREIVLSGIETAAYGAENLLRLAAQIAEVEGIERIRFGSLKPSLFTPEFCRGLSQNEKIMPQFHLSVQSGSSHVLELMRRDYDREKLMESVDQLRARIDHAALTADLICGFPGESEADFSDTVSFVREARLLHAHIFPYSEREGTRAAGFERQVEVSVRRARAAELAEVAQEVREFEMRRIMPLENEILIERFRGGFAMGHTEHFIELSLPRSAFDAVGSLKKVKE